MFHIATAAAAVREQLARDPSPELRSRLEALLETRAGTRSSNAGPIDQARRILDYCK